MKSIAVNKESGQYFKSIYLSEQNENSYPSFPSKKNEGMPVVL